MAAARASGDASKQTEETAGGRLLGFSPHGAVREVGKAARGGNSKKGEGSSPQRASPRGRRCEGREGAHGRLVGACGGLVGRSSSQAVSVEQRPGLARNGVACWTHKERTVSKITHKRLPGGQAVVSEREG